MEKDFKTWHNLKSRLDASHSGVFFKEREIWWSAVGCNIGTEVDGKSIKFSRPVLVFRKLSHYSFLGMPMSTKEKTGSWYAPVTQQGIKAIVLLHQIRLFDNKRLLEKLGTLDDTDWEVVEDGFKKLVG